LKLIEIDTLNGRINYSVSAPGILKNETLVMKNIYRVIFVLCLMFLAGCPRPLTHVLVNNTDAQITVVGETTVQSLSAGSSLAIPNGSDLLNWRNNAQGQLISHLVLKRGETIVSYALIFELPSDWKQTGGSDQIELRLEGDGSITVSQIEGSLPSKGRTSAKLLPSSD
jgi:hypothetical protein